MAKLDSIVEDDLESKTESDALILGEYYVRDNYEHFVKRSYSGYNWFHITFKPYDVPYKKDSGWFAVKCQDAIRKFLSKSCDLIIITREMLDCKKVHMNALVVSTRDLVEDFDNTSFSNKYKMRVNKCGDYGDRFNVLMYIFKENDTKKKHNRRFIKYLDYVHYERKGPVFKTFKARRIV